MLSVQRTDTSSAQCKPFSVLGTQKKFRWKVKHWNLTLSSRQGDTVRKWIYLHSREYHASFLDSSRAPYAQGKRKA